MQPAKFTIGDITILRDELIASGVDIFQAGMLLHNFMSDRGYGVELADAIAAIERTRKPGITIHLETLHQELTRMSLMQAN